MDFFAGMFLGILLTAIAVKIITWWTLREMRRRGLARLLADLEKNTELDQDSGIVSLRVERYQDMFLFFDADTKQFVTQGRDFQEVSLALKQMFQNRTVAITEGDAEDIAQFRATQAS